jgi:hypothetical protein
MVARCGERPSLILHPELDFPLLPQGLTELNIPTACFQIDTYAFTKHRIRWSMLFDHPIVFHPGCQEQFQRAGHSGLITIYHAAARDLFDKPEIERIFDVGWVGRAFAGMPIHKTRNRILTLLADTFQVNDWKKFHSFEEMAEVYRRSKVVVNVARDDFPQDANMRAFEAMAAGSLLISRMPSELTAIGFQEGVHFVGYRDEREIINLVTEYLREEQARCSISTAGRHKVLNEHTYDSRVDFLLQEMEQRSDKFFAPARQWTEARTRLCYLHYYASHRLPSTAHSSSCDYRPPRLAPCARGDASRPCWARELCRRVASVSPLANRECGNDSINDTESLRKHMAQPYLQRQVSNNDVWHRTGLDEAPAEGLAVQPLALV